MRSTRNKNYSKQKPSRCFVCFDSKDGIDAYLNHKVPLKIPERVLNFMSEKLALDIVRSLKSPSSSVHNFYCTKCIQFSTNLSRLFVQLDELNSQIDASILLYVDRITNCRQTNGNVAEEDSTNISKENSTNISKENSIKISEDIFCENNDFEDDLPSPVNYASESEDNDIDEIKETVSSKCEDTLHYEPKQTRQQKRLPIILRKAIVKKEPTSPLKKLVTKTESAVKKRGRPKKRWLLSTYGENALKLSVSLARIVPPQCKTCKTLFVSKTALETHKKATSHDDISFESSEVHPILKCPTCKIHLHIMKTYQKLKPGHCSVRCSKCKKSFVAAKVINKKQKTKSIISKVHKMKGSTFPQTASKKHKVYRFKCELCPKVFWSEAGLSTHIESHENNDQKKVQVVNNSVKPNGTPNQKEDVPNRTPNKQKEDVPNVNSIVSDALSGQTPINATAKSKMYQCKKCLKHFATENALIVHETEHKLCDLIQCNFCKTKVGPRLLKSHMKYYHPNEHPNNEEDEEDDIIELDDNPSEGENQTTKTDSPSTGLITPTQKTNTVKPLEELPKSSLKCMICKNPLERYEAIPKNLVKVKMPGKSSFYCSHCKKAFILATNSKAISTYYNSAKREEAKAIENAKKIIDESMPSNKPTAEQNKYKCSDCTGMFASQYILIVHRNRHCVNIKRNCELCVKEFETARKLKAHVNSNHPEFPKSDWNFCSDCDESYSDEAIHQSFCSRKMEKQCDQCEFSSRNELLLIKHLVDVHRHGVPLNYRTGSLQKSVGKKSVGKVEEVDDGQNRLCEQCGGIFPNIKLHYRRCKHNLKRKAQRQKQQDEKRRLKRIEKKKKAKAAVKMRYICNFCPGEGNELVNFKGQKELRQHVNDVHIFVHKCEICDKGFRSSGGLKLHAQHVHPTNN